MPEIITSVVAVTAFGLEIAEWALLITGVFIAAEITGFSRSGRTARKDNADLRERNATLEGEVRTLEEKAASQQRQIDELTKQVTDLQERNVDALWLAYREHDQRVTEGHQALGETMTRLAKRAGSTRPGTGSSSSGTTSRPTPTRRRQAATPGRT